MIQPSANYEPQTLEEWTQALRDREMPVFSYTVQTINALVEDEKKGATDLAAAILQDPNLTAKLLKLSNSIYYNPTRKKIITVSRAIVVLGVSVIRELVLACSFLEAVLSPTNRRQANEEIAKAIHAAVHARAIALATKDPFPEEVFIAALLKHIGAIAYWCFCRESGERLLEALQDPSVTPEQAEKRVLGFKLTDLDIALCKAWSFKGLIEEAMKPPAKANDPRVKLVHLGCDIVTALLAGFDSAPYAACVQQIKTLTLQSTEEIEWQLRKNTEAAANIAQHFGATEAANLIQFKVKREDESAEKIDRKQLQIEILQDITLILSGRIDVNLLLETVLEGIQRALAMDRTLFALLNKEKTALQEKIAFGWYKKSFTEKIALPVVKSPPNLFQHALLRPEGLWLNPERDRTLLQTSGHEGIGQYACFLMPIYSAEQPVGVVYSDRAIGQQPLTENDFKSFKQFVQQANIGLSLYRLQGRGEAR